MFIIFMVMKMDWNKGNRQKTQIDVFCLSKVDFKLEPQGSNIKTCLQSKILTQSKNIIYFTTNSVNSLLFLRISPSLIN
jgi:hypothetical protein